MNLDLSHLIEVFGESFEAREVRPGVTEITLPMYTEDGDPLGIYLTTDSEGQPVLTDLASTLMRLSYDYNVNTERRQEIFKRIVLESGLEEEDGELFLKVESADLYPSLLQFAQTISKIGTMSYFHKEIIASLFAEELREAVFSRFEQYGPEENVAPVPGDKDSVADYAFTKNLAQPVYMFGIKNSGNAKDANISLLNFLGAELKYQGYVVYEDYKKVTDRDFRRLTNVADKQFLDLGGFLEHGPQAFARMRIS